MSLICMGRNVLFVAEDGREVSAHKRDGMLYDGSGIYWPSCSLLVAPFRQGTRESEKGRDYFGRGFRVLEGTVSLPPRSLKQWREIGEIKHVYYRRAGKHSAYFHHEFDRPRGLWRLIWPVKRGSQPVALYSFGGCFRVELPAGCIVDDRGIVLP